MRRKILFWSSIGLLLLGLLYWWFWPRDPLTPENLAKVHAGVTLSQAKQLLGEPLNKSDYGPTTTRHVNTAKGSFLDYFYLMPRSAWLPTISPQAPLTEEESNDLDRIDTESRHLWVGGKIMLIAACDEHQVI